MNISREGKKQEALRRLKVLQDKFELGPKLVNYFKDDKLYYSYGYSMDTINYDDRYVKAVKKLESTYHMLVYHAIEICNGADRILSLLYVGDMKDEWSVEELMGNCIMSYTFIAGEEEKGEFGTIMLDSPLGYLMRVG
ncbi:MAG: hypothetical protein ACI4W6_07535 [Acutalibacteraceae bacterium]